MQFNVLCLDGDSNLGLMVSMPGLFPSDYSSPWMDIKNTTLSSDKSARAKPPSLIGFRVRVSLMVSDY